MQVLIVCTANQCRSPMAEFLLRQRTKLLGIDWSISSAGTHALEGLPMHHNTAKLLHQRQISVPGTWRTRAVDAESLTGSDLILTANREQRSMIVEQLPQTLSTTFTILQFARYAQLTRESGLWQPGQSSQQLLDVLSRTVPAANASDDDLADPVGRRYRPFKICAGSLDAAIDQILGRHAGRHVAPPTTQR